MTDEAMSPLRRRVIDDMTIRKSAEDPKSYIRTIKDFAAFLGRSPDTASFEDVRRFQLHLAARQRSGHTDSNNASRLSCFAQTPCGQGATVCVDISGRGRRS
jgi:integrase/recombinase XerD